MDQLLQVWMGGLIELAKLEWMLGFGESWRPGTKLKLLFAGYNGTRNTGSDVRVEEMLRQVGRVLGEGNLELAVMTHNPELSRGYFGEATQVHLPALFPPFLFREVPRHHGVVACEGSMFKSKWANALTTMMVGSLGIASAENKLSVGYGAEAGQMDPLMVKMVERYCGESLVITRNEESRTILRGLSVPTELGTDTAWTFEPLGAEYGTRALRDAGWDGKQPVWIFCPINPFFWPVKPSLMKTLARVTTGAYQSSHYRSLYFHNSGPQVERAYERYLTAFANAVAEFRKQQEMFPVVVGMERLDSDACRRMAERLGGAPVFSSEQYDMFQLVSILRRAQFLVSSRYHAIVTSMPGLVASAGVTMDERIRNLMRERGHSHLALEVDDPDLEAKLIDVMRRLAQQADAVRDGIGRTVVRNLKMMARMGVYLEEHVARRYPEFPVRSGLLSWEDYLPPLSPALRKLVEVYGE